MAMIFTEGFDSYISAATLRNRFAIVGSPWTIAPTGGRLGGPSLYSNGSVGGSVVRAPAGTFPGTAQTLGFGFWLKISALPASNTGIFRLVTTAGAALRLIVTTSGRLVVDDLSITRANGFYSVADDNWHWVEFTMSGGGGPGYVDSIQQWTSIGAGVASPLWDYFQFSNVLDRDMFVDDIFVFNNASGFPQITNHPVGPSIIEAFRPTIDTEDFHEFDRSTGGSNAALVREAVLNLSNWVQSDVPADQDLYFYDTALPTDPPPDAIHTAMVSTQLRNPDVGNVTFNNICRSGATQQTATAQTVPTSRRCRQDSFPADPATSAEWLPDALNAAEFGVRLAGVS